MDWWGSPSVRWSLNDVTRKILVCIWCVIGGDLTLSRFCPWISGKNEFVTLNVRPLFCPMFYQLNNCSGTNKKFWGLVWSEMLSL
jgi:hypothetical protein